MMRSEGGRPKDRADQGESVCVCVRPSELLNLKLWKHREGGGRHLVSRSNYTGAFSRHVKVRIHELLAAPSVLILHSGMLGRFSAGM
jgi:hypothetical protein